MTEHDTSFDEFTERLRGIIEDIGLGRVRPKQIAEIEAAIHRHQTDQAVNRAIRPR
jgi:hypothetical protein